jgi:spore germination cell wall hydrolase CwlJ-like protein
MLITNFRGGDAIGLQRQEEGKEEIMAREETIRLANMIYGEVGSLDEETMAKVGSTMFNRMNAGREQEFGLSQMDVLRKGYNAVKDSNDPYTWATTGKFPNKDEEGRYKKALQVAYGLEMGSIPIQEGMFFFTPKEEARMRKQGKKVFDFSQVRKVGNDKNYNYYSY